VTDAKLKVAINGFGRIGRNFVRCLESRGPDAPMEIVCINDSGGVKQASHLLKYAPCFPFHLVSVHSPPVAGCSTRLRGLWSSRCRWP
jgi:glyceraldehyde-3-phosphate dehydrogenase/erythrose-4-phosphate dehydrogenase